MHSCSSTRALLTVLAALAAACGNERPAPVGGPSDGALVAIDGSRAVLPVAERVAEAFARNNPNIRTPTVGRSGTAGGFQALCRREIDVSTASRPIRPAEIAQCRGAGIEFIELPFAFDGIAVAVHPQNDWAGNVTTAELAALWSPKAQGSVTRWRQVRPSWPDREIKLFGPPPDSGTYSYFTRAILGTDGMSRTDFNSDGDYEALAAAIAVDASALGVIPLAYAQNEGRLKVLPIDDGQPGNGSGAVAPSNDTLTQGTYQPLLRPLFIYVSRTAADRSEVQQVVDLFLGSTDVIRPDGYVGLTPDLSDAVRRRLQGRRTGTAFAQGNAPIGMTFTTLLDVER